MARPSPTRLRYRSTLTGQDLNLTSQQGTGAHSGLDSLTAGSEVLRVAAYLPIRCRCVLMRDTAAIEGGFYQARELLVNERDQKVQDAGNKCDGLTRCRWLRRFRVLSLAMMMMCGTAARRFGRVAQADDWSTHRRSLPREIFKLASTWLIWCDVLESGCDSRVGRSGEVQSPAQDAQLSWCSSLRYYQAPAALNPRSWTVRPRERHRRRQPGTIPTPRAAATAVARWGRVVVVNCREKFGGPARAEVDVPAQWTLCPFTAEQDAILVRPGRRVA